MPWSASDLTAARVNAHHCARGRREHPHDAPGRQLVSHPKALDASSFDERPGGEAFIDEHQAGFRSLSPRERLDRRDLTRPITMLGCTRGDDARLNAPRAQSLGRLQHELASMYEEQRARALVRRGSDHGCRDYRLATSGRQHHYDAPLAEPVLRARVFDGAELVVAEDHGRTWVMRNTPCCNRTAHARHRLALLPVERSFPQSMQTTTSPTLHAWQTLCASSVRVRAQREQGRG